MVRVLCGSPRLDSESLTFIYIWSVRCLFPGAFQAMAGYEDREVVHEENRKSLPTSKYLGSDRFRALLLFAFGLFYSLILFTAHYTGGFNGDEGREETGATDNRSSFRRKLHKNYLQKGLFGHESITKDEERETTLFSQEYQRSLLVGEDPKKVREIFLVGDSLMQVPEVYFELPKRVREGLKADYPEYSIRVKSFTERSYRMHNISMGLQEIFNLREDSRIAAPEAIVIYGYSDMVDELDSGTEFSGVTDAQSHYRKSLTHLMKFLEKRVMHVAVMGPTLFGPSGEMPIAWKDKTEAHRMLLDKYNIINKEVCRKYPIATYIDTRTKFQNYIRKAVAEDGKKVQDLSNMVARNWRDIHPFNGGRLGGLLTFDGEHTNKDGTDLLYESIISILKEWGDLWGRRDTSKDPKPEVVVPKYTDEQLGIVKGSTFGSGIVSEVMSVFGFGKSSGNNGGGSVSGSYGVSQFAKQSSSPDPDTSSAESEKSDTPSFGFENTVTSPLNSEDASPLLESEPDLDTRNQEGGSTDSYSGFGNADRQSSTNSGTALSTNFGFSFDPNKYDLHGNVINGGPSNGQQQGQSGNGEDYKEIGDGGDEGAVRAAKSSEEDDRSSWSPEKRACFDWRDQFGVITGVSWGRLPFELQVKWEQFNCNDFMDCHTAACSYHSGTPEHFDAQHPVFQRPQSAADWEIANGFIPNSKILKKQKQDEILKKVQEEEARTGKADVDLAQIEFEKKYTAQAFQKQVLTPSSNDNDGVAREEDTNEEAQKEESEFQHPEEEKIKKKHHKHKHSVPDI